MDFPDGVSDAHVAKDVAARRRHQLLAVFSNLLAGVQANPADHLGMTSRWIRRNWGAGGGVRKGNVDFVVMFAVCTIDSSGFVVVYVGDDA